MLSIKQLSTNSRKLKIARNLTTTKSIVESTTADLSFNFSLNINVDACVLVASICEELCDCVGLQWGSDPISEWKDFWKSLTPYQRTDFAAWLAEDELLCNLDIFEFMAPTH